jgi:hypothetical protein
MPKKTPKPAKKTTSTKKAARSTKRLASPARADAERRRLLKEERALERDMASDKESGSLRKSAEFIPEALHDDLAEEMGEASVESATSGTQADEDIRDEDLPEEEGGPFVPSSARKEFARGIDASNPEDAEPEDFPTANRRRR